MMRFRYRLSQTTRQITRRYPLLRRFSRVTALLTIVWVYVVFTSERSSFESHIRGCQWDQWEKWPEDAVPHHLVFVADPQLVDPHTYPGRPWPLSSLTESYTDLYMTRNFRLINEKLDPDSIVFLGDLLDGGREWSTTLPRQLKASQREILVKLGILKEGEIEGQKSSAGLVDSISNTPILALDVIAKMHRNAQKEPPKTRKHSLKAFVPGENGRWAKYGEKQWITEFERFGRIFFAAEQLYPNSRRELVPAWNVSPDSISIENGAKEITRQEYAIAGGKHRRLVTSLPGNHDLGFGSGVQLSVRSRFQSYFGETNSVYVIGNHTFVGIDGPSLSAFDEFVPGGGEVSTDQRNEQYHVWKPTMDFLDDLPSIATKVVANALDELYPGNHILQRHQHEALQVEDVEPSPAKQAKSKKQPNLPVILLSHVPLFRNPDTDCGKLREKGKAISISQGYQYQNVLTPSLSGLIAKKVSAAGSIEYIFSGDDHDYCDIDHRFNVGRWSENDQKEQIILKTVREITVKSFSWAMGVRKPGFQLMSLWNPIDEHGRRIGAPSPTIQTHLCLLPDQLGIFINYALMFGWTMLILFTRAIIIGLRNIPIPDNDENDDSEQEQSQRLELPRFKSRFDAVQISKANGYSNPNENQVHTTKGRQRATSTSLSTSNGSSKNLGVQRSYNARTRSVSPAAFEAGSNSNFNVNGNGVANLYEPTSTLSENAIYHPPIPWQDPDDSDEESHLGEDGKDSQAKWKKRKRSPGRARRAWNEFVVSVALVGVPISLFYGFLIRNG